MDATTVRSQPLMNHLDKTYAKDLELGLTTLCEPNPRL